MAPPRKRAKICQGEQESRRTSVRSPSTYSAEKQHSVSHDRAIVDPTTGHLPSPVSELEDVSLFVETTAERVKRRRKLPSRLFSATSIASQPRSRTTKQKYPSKAVSLASEEAHTTQDQGTNTKVEESIDTSTPVMAPVYTPARSHEDEAFAKAVLDELRDAEVDHATNIGLRQLKRVSKLLRKASRATQEEGPWLTAEEAAKSVAPAHLHAGPIFVANQQPHPLVTVQEFLSEFYDDSASIWIQDAAADALLGTTREITVAEVKQRLNGPISKYPWNCLELASPIEDGVRPKFLNSSECWLLTKIKIPPSAGGSNVTKVGRRTLVPGYKEAEKWALLAEAGALTEPHQDSHGYNTFITINDGQLGFGWLHKPTVAERKQWLKSPHAFMGGRWRYVVLRPGETVYFPAGTVHFVFRLRAAGHTLAFGGFVLRCSTIAQWTEALLREKACPYITNEDLTTSVVSHLGQVEKFVLQAQKSGNVADLARWGGKTSIEKFLKLKRIFMGKGKETTKSSSSDHDE